MVSIVHVCLVFYLLAFARALRLFASVPLVQTGACFVLALHCARRCIALGVPYFGSSSYHTFALALNCSALTYFSIPLCYVHLCAALPTKVNPYQQGHYDLGLFVQFRTYVFTLPFWVQTDPCTI